MHKNSQKRIYRKYAIYTLAFVTRDRYPYFSNESLCELFIEELRLCKKIRGFKLFAFCVLPEHVHLMIMPNVKDDISKIMAFLKRNSSRNINYVMGFNENDKRFYEGEHDHVRLRGMEINDAIEMDKKLINMKNKSVFDEFPKFAWQKSFRDHIIRNKKDYENQMRYITFNYLKHGLDYQYKYTSKNYPDLIDFDY